MKADFQNMVERTYLRIFKRAIIVLLTLALIGSAALILKAVGEGSASAAAVEPPKAAPKPSVDADTYVSEIVNSNASPEPGPTASEQPRVTVSENNGRQRVRRQIDVLFSHFKHYQEHCGIEPELRANRAEFGELFDLDIMTNLFAEHGEEFFESQAEFIKSVLNNDKIISLCRSKNQRPQIFWTSINWHQTAWQASKEKSSAFASTEADRFATETAIEENRVAQKHADAKQSLTAAFIAFGIFMAIMLILIFFKIQEGFHLVASAIREGK